MSETEPQKTTDEEDKQPVNLEAPPPEGTNTESSMAPRPRTLPLYQSHKVVEAAKIVAVDADPGGRWRMTLVGSDGSESFPIYHEVSRVWMAKHEGEDPSKLVGYYLVRYDDGYEAVCPADRFEEAYSPAAPAGTVPPEPMPGGETIRAEGEPMRPVVPTFGALNDPVVRSIDTHKVNVANERLQIDVLDGPGADGASHLYRISGFDTSSNPSCPFVRRYGEPAKHASVLFQNGPILESGVNGVTHEALLAIVMDRLEAFQAGPFACYENAHALEHVRVAMRMLKIRTDRRLAAGTEGTHQGN